MTIKAEIAKLRHERNKLLGRIMAFNKKISHLEDEIFKLEKELSDDTTR